MTKVLDAMVQVLAPSGGGTYTERFGDIEVLCPKCGKMVAVKALIEGGTHQGTYGCRDRAAHRLALRDGLARAIYDERVYRMAGVGVRAVETKRPYRTKRRRGMIHEAYVRPQDNETVKLAFSMMQGVDSTALRGMVSKFAHIMASLGREVGGSRDCLAALYLKVAQDQDAYEMLVTLHAFGAGPEQVLGWTDTHLAEHPRRVPQERP